MLDFNPVFSTHIISFFFPTPIDLPLQIENNNQIICYSTEEFSQAMNYLQKNKIPYTVGSTNWDQQVKDKVKDNKYQSRTEIIEHILENKEPENMKLPRLIKENEGLKVKLKEAEDNVINLAFGKDLPDELIQRNFREGKISVDDIRKRMPHKIYLTNI